MSGNGYRHANSGFKGVQGTQGGRRGSVQGRHIARRGAIELSGEERNIEQTFDSGTDFRYTVFINWVGWDRAKTHDK